MHEVSYKRQRNAANASSMAYCRMKAKFAAPDSITECLIIDLEVIGVE